MWRKVVRLQVALHGLRAGVWRGRRLLAQAQQGIPEGGGPGAALERLLATLAEQTALRGALAEVVWADDCVTLDVVQGEFADHGERQLQAVASACVAELLGAAGADHELRWQLQRDERHLLICALPRAALVELDKTLGLHGIRLWRAEPQLCRSWNRHLRQLGKGPAVLAVVGAASTTIAFVHDGAIAALGRCVAGEGNAIRLLDAQVSRLQASLGMEVQDATRHFLVAEELPATEALERWTPLPNHAEATLGSQP